MQSHQATCIVTDLNSSIARLTLLTVSDLHRITGMSHAWIRKHSKTGGPRPNIPAIKCGTEWRYHPGSIINWLADLESDGGKA